MIGIWRRAYFRRRPSREDKFHALLPSNLPGLYFQAHFSLSWRSISKIPLAAAGRIAIGCVQDAAERISVGFPVTRLHAAQNRVNSELVRIRYEVNDGVLLEAAHASLCVDEETELVAVSHERRVRAGLLPASDSDASVEKIREFRKEILGNPGSALTYWFMRNPEQLDEKVYSQINRIVQVVADHDDESVWIRLAQLLQRFIQDLRHEEKEDLLKLLILLFETYGQRELEADASGLLEEFLRRKAFAVEDSET